MRVFFRTWLAAALLAVAAGAASAATGSWLTLAGTVNGAAKGALVAPGERDVNVNLNALFAHAHGETRNIAVSDTRELALTGLRVLEGASGARTWVGMHRDGDAEHNVFVTEHQGYVYGTLYASDTTYILSGDSKRGSIRLLDQRAAGHTLAPPTTHDFVEPPLLP
ncbi:MAG TPA: hypothetical protein PLD41_13140, partial [Casimicrobium huifangae]|nr:hypothetical protein [Casimicrobium huifangae]